MRITRAAKVAAFPLIVLALVALVACQGGPGTKGEKGDTGDMGDMGAPGTNAPIPLTGRDGGVVIDSLNAANDKEDAKATEFTIDLHADGYFNGGMAPFKYKVTGITDSNISRGAITLPLGEEDPLVTAEIDEDTNLLKLKLNVDFMWDTAEGTDYITGFTIALSAEDANMESADSSLTIKPNRLPMLAAGVTKEAGSDRLSDDNAGFVVGIMDDEVDTKENEEGNQPRGDDAATFSCATMNSCVLSLFQDDGDYMIEVISNPGGSYAWKDERGGKLKLTGLARTDDPVDVDVTAMDKDGLTLNVRFTLDVNGPPTMSDAAAGLDRNITIAHGSADQKLFETTDAAMAAFSDPDMDMVMVTYRSENKAVVTIVEETGVMTGEGRGSATVVAIGTTGDATTDGDTDGLGQYFEIEFSVTVE